METKFGIKISKDELPVEEYRQARTKTGELFLERMKKLGYRMSSNFVDNLTSCGSIIIIHGCLFQTFVKEQEVVTVSVLSYQNAFDFFSEPQDCCVKLYNGTEKSIKALELMLEKIETEIQKQKS